MYRYQWSRFLVQHLLIKCVSYLFRRLVHHKCFEFASQKGPSRRLGAQGIVIQNASSQPKHLTCESLRTSLCNDSDLTTAVNPSSPLCL